MQPTISAEFMRVRVEHPRGSSAGPLMSGMRTWLDHRGIQPMDFRALTLPFGNIAFDVAFRHPDQATLFRAAFAG